MTFDEIEKRVFSGEDAPKYISLEESFCFEVLHLLYQRYVQGTISKSDAGIRKNKYKILFEQAKANHDKYREAEKHYQDNIRRGKELRSEIIKGAKEGCDAQELLLIAVNCISLMTDDGSFAEMVTDEIHKTL